MERNRWWSFLYGGWSRAVRAAGALSLLKDIATGDLTTWAWRLVPTSMLAVGSMTLWLGAWVAGAALLTATFGVAVAAYFLDQPLKRRPYVLSTVPMTMESVPPSPPGATLMVKLMNVGIPSPLTDWRAYIDCDGHTYTLAIPAELNQSHIGYNAPDGQTYQAPALIEATEQPVGLAIVSGFISVVTNQLSYLDIDRSISTIRVTCRDSRMRLKTIRVRGKHVTVDGPLSMSGVAFAGLRRVGRWRTRRPKP